MNYWDQMKQHFADKDNHAEIVKQIIIAARKYDDSCAQCHWGEPCGYGIVNLSNTKTARKCMKGLDTNFARHCPEFRPHSVLRLFRLSCPGEMSVKALAASLGLHEGTVWPYELGYRNMKLTTARKYAEALGIEPGDLMI